MTDETDAKPTGVALIGAGMIAQRHVTALSAARTRARLVAIVSRHPERARHLAEHYNGPAPLLTSDLSIIAQDPAVQIVIIATPPSARIELIEPLANSGKQILLEKPVARTLEEATHIVQICKRAGAVLGVLFQHRMRAPSQVATRLLSGGTLGEPGLIEISVPLWRAQSYYDELGRGTYARDGGGVLITQAIHTIDLALSLAGPVSRVQAMTATTPLHQMEAEDYAVAGLHFASGAVGSLVASTATFPHGRETINLHCRHGSLSIGAEVLEVSWRDGRIERYPADAETAAPKDTITPKHLWHQAVIEDFIVAVQQGHEPMVTGHTALASHRLIDAIETSSRDGVPVEITL